jgi:threonine/homoserine/homoserine lactone efflux protein
MELRPQRCHPSCPGQPCSVCCLVPGLGTLLLFALVTLALVATPGPALLYVVGRAAGENRRAGFASMLGVEAGEVVYVICAAAGLSALLAHSTLALSGLRYLGAVYLILIGLRHWRRSGRDDEQAPVPTRHAFVQGLFVQVLNPKVALFFLAYFPQFLRPDHAVAPQVLLLGAVYVLVAVASDSVYVLLASSLAARIGRTARARRRQSRLSALTYLALGVAGAVSGDRHGSARAFGRLSLAVS